MNWSGSASVAVVDEPDIISLRWGEGVRKSESCDPTVPHPRVLAGIKCNTLVWILYNRFRMRLVVHGQQHVLFVCLRRYQKRFL